MPVSFDKNRQFISFLSIFFEDTIALIPSVKYAYIKICWGFGNFTKLKEHRSFSAMFKISVSETFKLGITITPDRLSIRVLREHHHSTWKCLCVWKLFFSPAFMHSLMLQFVLTVPKKNKNLLLFSFLLTSTVVNPLRCVSVIALAHQFGFFFFFGNLQKLSDFNV